MPRVRLTSAEIQAQKRAEKQLAGIPRNGSLQMILDAISRCVPVAAGLIQGVNDAAPTTLSGHAVGLPLFIQEAWMSTPREYLSRALGPAIKAKVGDFWVAEDLAASIQQNLAVLDKLPAFALGEGAGYKILTRPAPTKGTEHFFLALITPPDKRFGPRAGHLLRGLAPAVGDALVRVRLPIMPMQRLVSMVVEQDGIGYVLMTRSGTVRETNREAHELAQRYGGAAGAPRSRYMLGELLGKVKETLGTGAGPMSIARGGQVLDIRRYTLRARAHDLAEDMVLLWLRERADAPSRAHRPVPAPEGGELSLRQREIAELLVNTGLTYTGIAKELRVSYGTVRTVVSHLYQAYRVHDRDGLVRLCHPTRSAVAPGARPAPAKGRRK